MSPYRIRAPHPAPEGEEVCLDADLVTVLVVFWIASVARVVAGAMMRERPGAECTLALLAGLFVPVLLARTWRSWRRASLK